MMKSMAVELASRRIRVNSVNPGVVQTPLSAKSPYFKNETSFEKIRQRHLLGLGHAEDVSAAIIYLLSDAARWSQERRWWWIYCTLNKYK